MALPKTIDRPEDVPEIARDHYAQKDGVWTLTLLSSDEHSGLVSALDKERKARRDVETQLSGLKTKFDGIEPEEVTQLRDKLKSFDDKQVYDKHGLEELVERRTHEMKTTHERQLAAKERELSTEREQRLSTDRKWREDRIETALLSAASKAGVSKTALADAVARGKRVFNALDEQGNAIAQEGDEIKYGKDGVSPYTPDEFVLALKVEAPHLWPPSSGGGAQNGHNTSAGNGIDYSKISSPTERLTKFREAQTAKG